MTHEHASDVQCQSAEFLMACLFVLVLLVIFGGSSLIRLYYSIEDTSPPVVAIAPIAAQPIPATVIAKIIEKPAKRRKSRPTSCDDYPECRAWAETFPQIVGIMPADEVWHGQ